MIISIMRNNSIIRKTICNESEQLPLQHDGDIFLLDERCLVDFPFVVLTKLISVTREYSKGPLYIGLF